MSTVAQQIANNVNCVRECIAQAAISAGRSPDEITLVAVSKYVGVVEAAALLDAGCNILGESRPQHLWQMAGEPELDNAQWHLIGHLQRNKVQRTLPLVDLIHSVDSWRLLQSIDRHAGQLNRRSRVLLEVNCSGEPEKHGLTPDGLKELMANALSLEFVDICGLMTMAARTGGEVVAARNFAKLRQLRDELSSACPSEINLTELSMGMSHDFEVAIREGSTLVRIGSRLFDGIQL